MWSIVTGICTVVGGLLGLLTTTNPKLIESPLKPLLVGVFSCVLIVGAVSTWMDQREDAKQSETALRQVTGRGGFPTVTVVGYLPIEGQIKNGRVLAQFMVLNHSAVPVFDCRIKVTQLVGVPHGFMGSDSFVFPVTSIESVYPHDAPKTLFVQPVLRLDKPNIFTAAVFSRSATFTQKIVVLWKDGAWHADTEVVQSADEDRNNERTIFKTMKPEFRALLPEAWRTED